MSRLFGLTGGIATGKTLVSDILAELGASVVDADIVAREVVEIGSEGLAKIRTTFGEKVILKSGELDRERLSNVVFSDDSARQKLNSIVHPLIAKRSKDKIDELHAKGNALVIYSAALIVENNLRKNMQGLIVVHVTPEVQEQRLRSRDGLSESDARKRIQAQLPQQAKLDVATHTIDNSGTREQTRSLVVALWNEIKVNNHG